jgi:AraC-like DNA-binding protein
MVASLSQAVLEPEPVMMQRAGVSAELPSLIRELGNDPAPIFERSGLELTSFTPDTKLHFRTLVELLDNASSQTDCPHLGLLLGQRFVLAHHGIIGRLMAYGATLEQAFLDFIAWQPGYSSGAIVYMNRVGDEFALGYGTLDHVSPGLAQLYDCVLVIGLRMLTELTGSAIRPVEIHNSRRAPPNLTVHGRLLKAPLRYNQHRTALILDAATMARPLPSSDAQRRRQILDELRHSMWNPRSDTAARVRHALRPLLSAGDAGMTATAASLAIHPRTLRRRLAAAGQTFEALRDEVRLAMACELLAMTDIPLTDISRAVDFASSSVFSVSFKRWAGMSPSEWRKMKTLKGQAGLTLGQADSTALSSCGISPASLS